MKNRTKLLLILIITFYNQGFILARPDIVVSIAPIASLVYMLTKDKLNIMVLDKVGGCPHHHNLKLSDKLIATDAKMVIYIDESFERVISPLLVNYHGKKIRISQLDSISFNGVQGRINWHFWLDLENVKILQQKLATAIAKTFPEIKYEVQKNLSESLVKMNELSKLKEYKLAKLGSVVLVGDSLEHFFNHLKGCQLHIFQGSNNSFSLKSLEKFNHLISSNNVKCVVLDTNQNYELYKKYKKTIIQFDSENWVISEVGLNEKTFFDEYLKMINQLNICT